MPTTLDKDVLAFRCQFAAEDQAVAFPIRKFGMNLVTAAGDDVWDGSNVYTGWLATAAAIEVVSASVADDVGQNGATGIRIIGLDENYDRQTADVVMDGSTAVDVTGKKWIRVFRAYITGSGSGQVNAGNITIRVDGAGATLAIITAGYGQTEMCLYTIPAGYFGMLFSWHNEVKGESAATVTATFHISTNKNGEGWRVRQVCDVVDGGSEHHWMGGLKLDPKTDIRVRTSAISKAAPTSSEFALICMK